MWVVVIIAMGVAAVLAIAAVDRRFVAVGRRAVVAKPGAERASSLAVVDLRLPLDYQVLPHYVDLHVRDTVRIVKANGEQIDLRVVSIEAESRVYSCPRTRVQLEAHGEEYVAYCGMLKCDSGGIGPIDIDGIKLGVEITKLVYSRMKRGSSRFNAYRHFRLNGDLRLGIWDRAAGIMWGVNGAFVVDQPEWVRSKFGNWLHMTNYGTHSATDIYATRHGVPEKVLSPVDGVVYKVYNVDADPDDTRRSKAINIYGDAVVGPEGERVLYRFQHLSEIFVSKGEPVRQGQVIGLTGHTGFDPSIGDHLHFEIRLNPSHLGLEKDNDIFATIPVNPYNYLLEWYEKDRRKSAG
jgi:murein DD-endopeptidase MepM/ murein hydrolase activator NlpD